MAFRAILCREIGQPLEVGTVQRQPLEPEQVRIRLNWAAVNFPDVLMIRGDYQNKPALPFSPGLEGSGEIIEVGGSVGSLRVGQRVLAHTGNGLMAEEAVLHHDAVHALPDGIAMREAAAFPVTYGTSYYALVDRGELREGEWLAVLGAGGGVGIAAVEIGRALGARVIAAAGSPEKLALARDAGAEAVIDYRHEDLKTRLREITGQQGVDVVYDPVGGDATEAALRAIAWGGRLLIIGFAAGSIPRLPANLPLLRNADIRGVLWGGYTKRKAEAKRQAMDRLFALWLDGKLTPRISAEYAFEEAGQAIADLGARSIAGKAVIRIA